MGAKAGTSALAAIAGVPFIMVLGNSMLIPVLPQLQAALNLSELKVSMIITAFSIPGLLIPLAGFLSDRIGRKKVIIPGLILYGLGGVIAGLAAIFLHERAYTWIISGRIVQGIGAAGTTPIAMALTGDLFTGPKRSKALGVVEAANGFGKVLSPVLGAAIGLIAWYATFLFFPAIIIPIALGIWFLIKEPESNRATQSIAQYGKSIKKVFQKKSVLLATIFMGGMVALLILFGILFFLSDYLEETVGLTGIVKGAALAVPVLFMSVTSYVTGLLIKKKVRLMKWLVVTGLSLVAASLAALNLYQNIYFFFAGISITGLGTGLLLPCLNTIITSTTDAQERGLITSVYGSVRFLGVAAGPPLFGYLMGISSAYMYWGGAILAGVTALTALFFIRVKDLTMTDDTGQGQQPQEANGSAVQAIRPEFVFDPTRKPLPEKKENAGNNKRK
ncbi:MFS transporter [Desulfoscipio gibsoniae]|uniref:Arabinose efflux permease family protein n=1 Tax=Desulfoscipio gibsoniae DSM 7213 TaxID=767817 RepID=R4KS54_9FIRM|nr:MFS transporter [Desulfoscipio gibsoniae]AGL02436.1 arabinose efflux permease family protein [Desulfoscipio gibsoniae DSM 7213]